MRLLLIGMLLGPLAGWGGTAIAQSATSPLFGQVCTATFPHSIVRHAFITRNGMPVVHVWAKVPNGKDVWGDAGEVAVTIQPNGSLEFTTSAGFHTTVVPDGKGKAAVTITLRMGRSESATYDECHLSS